MRIEELSQTQSDSSNLANPFYISFSDLMVLLTVFFVMLLGMSEIKIGSFEKLKSGFSGSTKGTLIELAADLKVAAEQLPGIEIAMEDDGVRMNLPTAALFETGSAVLRKRSLDRFQPLFARVLKTKYTIDVEGHSDDRPFFKNTKTPEGIELDTNWSLSGRRASSVVHYLLDLGFEQERLRVVGYAATRPQLSIKQKYGLQLDKARAMNRRVSILVR